MQAIKVTWPRFLVTFVGHSIFISNSEEHSADIFSQIGFSWKKHNKNSAELNIIDLLSGSVSFFLLCPFHIWLESKDVEISSVHGKSWLIDPYIPTWFCVRIQCVVQNLQGRIFGSSVRFGYILLILWSSFITLLWNYHLLNYISKLIYMCFWMTILLC